MRLVGISLLIAALAQPAFAQSWTVKTPQDAADVGGWVTFPGNGVTVSCAARSPQNGPVIESIWFESTIAPPWHFSIDISPTLVPADTGVRSDLILFVDQTGYQLPPLSYNELEGGWKLTLSMADPILTPIRKASRLVLRVGAQAAWELPVANLGPALDELQATCAAGWSPQGQPIANGAPVGQDMRRVAEGFAASNCRDFFTAGPNGIQTANIDGDGIEDVILDYNDITCDAEARRPQVCGASLCSIDVFLSGSFARTNRPENLLGGSAAAVALSNGNMGVSTSGNLSMCQSTEPCAFMFYWDGAKFTDLPN